MTQQSAQKQARNKVSSRRRLEVAGAIFVNAADDNSSLFALAFRPCADAAIGLHTRCRWRPSLLFTTSLFHQDTAQLYFTPADGQEQRIFSRFTRSVIAQSHDTTASTAKARH